MTWAEDELAMEQKGETHWFGGGWSGMGVLWLRCAAGTSAWRVCPDACGLDAVLKIEPSAMTDSR